MVNKKTKNIVFIAMFSVIIAICSWISIPFQVPFTMQTFAIFCTLSILGGCNGSISVLVYILLGAIGIPVFAGFSGGIGILFGTTGGYIIGFLGTALIYWLITKLLGNKLWVTILAMVIGLFLCYALGTIWFMVAYANKTGPIGIGTALSYCVIPFIIPDLVKMVLAVLISDRVKKHVITTN